MATQSRQAVSWAISAVACLAAGGCPRPADAQSSQPSFHYGPPTAVCRITDPLLNEASGLVASQRHPGFYYTHNDSGGKPHVYVIDRKGRIFATFRLTGVKNVDWEDISLAPGDAPGKWDICVADIGDNNSKRAEVTIYRLAEQDLKSEAGDAVDLTPVPYRCKYLDGPRDAEGFAVDPKTGDGYVFTKRWDGVCDVYRMDGWDRLDVNWLERVGSLKFPDTAAIPPRIVTAADISTDGRRLVVRNYIGGWEWRRPETGDAGDFKSLFERTPTALRLASEPQGEALCFSADGRALLTISEKTPTTLYETRLIENEP